MDYKDSLNLPRTGFGMRADLAQREPELIARWEAMDLYGQLQAARAGAPRFVLHDGPPYANGQLHHGHVLNKVLKDMVVKDRSMAGFAAAYVPGWDCHGLPIEVQVDKSLGAKKATMEAADFQLACRAYAATQVEQQRDSFKRLGVFGRWAEPYLTMTPDYEATILRQLAHIAAAGLLYKGLRPVNWCCRHRTALAEAEVEYDTRRSPSIYVAMALTKRPDFLPAGDEPVALVIWTTTPWSLPANVAIAVHPEHTYVFYRHADQVLVVAEGRLAAFLAAIDAGPVVPEAIVARRPGAALTALAYVHPLLPRQGPVVLGEHVTLEVGTGCVHTAPGHGADDFELGRKYGLEVLSPIDDAGYFTAAGGVFVGQHVLAASPAIIAALVTVSALLGAADASLEHRYPHCWRCHEPLILRATEQWFMAMDLPLAGGASLRQRALAAVDVVHWLPETGAKRIRAMLAGRPDWCLSRQRLWGVPVPVIYCQACEAPFLSPPHILALADQVAQAGAGIWLQRSVAELFGDIRCGSCGGQSFRKERDILDVWFDSGSSYAAVLEAGGLGHAEGPPADLYLEGTDQHRGWFQSALLCSLAIHQRPPYRSVLTHGFVVDAKGRKISKSRGNFVDPFQAIVKDGAELQRLWVASEDTRDDVRLSPASMTRITDIYRKLRNTLRFLLGNLADFSPADDLLPAAELCEVDVYMLAYTARLGERILAAYASYQFHQALQGLSELCNMELSAFYLDVLKDRLYASAPRSVDRRSAQTALYLIARDLLRLLAPICSFTAEEAWQALPRWPGDAESVHLMRYPGQAEPPQIAALQAAVAAAGTALMVDYERLRGLRRRVNGVLEEARKAKTLGASTTAQVQIVSSRAGWAPFARWSMQALADFFIVSEVRWQVATQVEGEAGTASRSAAATDRGLAEDPVIQVLVAAGAKCGRCWLYRPEVGQDGDHPKLCGRCLGVLLEVSA